ncbi:hypothetical protein AVEN_148665-1, partial [Araneus ventricosus]
SSLPDLGEDQTALLRIYQSVILSRIYDGCEVYGSVCSSVLRRLDPVHHSALRICSGAFRTSLVHRMYAVCREMPLHLHRRKLGAQYCFRIQSHLNHPVRLLSTPVGLSRLYAAVSPRLYLSTRE